MFCDALCLRGTQVSVSVKTLLGPSPVRPFARCLRLSQHRILTTWPFTEKAGGPVLVTSLPP